MHFMLSRIFLPPFNLLFCNLLKIWNISTYIPSPRHGLWPTRVRRRPTSTTIQRTRPRRTTMRLSTAASMSTHRWQGRSMGQSTIRAPRTLMQKSSWGWEKARSTAGAGLAIAHLTRPVLPLPRRFELGAPAQARPYAHGQTLHRPRWRHSGLFLFYPSFIDFWIRLCFVF